MHFKPDLISKVFEYVGMTWRHILVILNKQQVRLRLGFIRKWKTVLFEGLGVTSGLFLFCSMVIVME